MNNVIDNTSHGIGKVLSRRSLLRGAPVAAAAITMPSMALAHQSNGLQRPVDTQMPMTPRERADMHWMAFCAALEDMCDNPDGRFQIFGSHVSERNFPCFRAESMICKGEEVRPGVIIPVERSVASLHRGAYGWAEV